MTRFDLIITSFTKQKKEAEKSEATLRNSCSLAPPRHSPVRRLLREESFLMTEVLSSRREQIEGKRTTGNSLLGVLHLLFGYC